MEFKWKKETLKVEVEKFGKANITVRQQLDLVWPCLGELAGNKAREKTELVRKTREQIDQAQKCGFFPQDLEHVDVLKAVAIIMAGFDELAPNSVPRSSPSTGAAEPDERGDLDPEAELVKCWNTREDRCKPRVYVAKNNLGQGCGGYCRKELYDTVVQGVRQTVHDVFSSEFEDETETEGPQACAQGKQQREEEEGPSMGTWPILSTADGDKGRGATLTTSNDRAETNTVQYQTRSATKPQIQAPLLTAAHDPHTRIYSPFSLTDRACLTDKLPAPSGGGAIFMQRFTDATQGLPLGMGDLRAICGTKLTFQELRNLEEIAGTHNLRDELPLTGAILREVGSAMRRMFPAPLGLLSNCVFQMGKSETGLAYLSRTRREWTEASGMDPSASLLMTQLYREAVLKGSPVEVADQLRDDPSLTNADQAEWKTHFLHRHTRFQEREKSNADREEAMRKELLQLQVQEAKRANTAYKKDKQMTQQTSLDAAGQGSSPAHAPRPGEAQSQFLPQLPAPPTQLALPAPPPAPTIQGAQLALTYPGQFPMQQ
ncbi:uncharacterized protein LOC119126071 [Syngnathus acus]|uniref:uncharacterized protein LOC119126071 n=1 Tax=Syngnathus acus TaxID=161584 RepID=UPI001885F47B|nr:uncharacterized protein LOC119126071 [Syngnathus acus]